MTIDYSAIFSDPAAFAALANALVGATAKGKGKGKGATLAQAVATPPKPIASNAKATPKASPAPKTVTIPSDSAFMDLTGERVRVDTTCAVATHRYGRMLVSAMDAFGGPVYSSDSNKIGFAQAWFEAEKRDRAAKGIDEPKDAKPFAGSYFSRARNAMKEFPNVDASNARDFLARFWGYGGRQAAKAKAKATQKPEDAIKVALSWLNTAVNRGGDPAQVLASIVKGFKEAHSI